MRQFLTSGSARGVRSNLHPYRDHPVGEAGGVLTAKMISERRRRGTRFAARRRYSIAHAQVMKTASIRELRYAFNKSERLLRQGEEVQITKRRRVIARLVPENGQASPEMPNFLERLRAIYERRN